MQRYIAMMTILLLVMFGVRWTRVLAQNDLEPIIVTNVEGIQPLQTLGQGTVLSMAISPDETLLTVGGLHSVWVYHLDNLEIPFTLLEGHTNGVSDLAFSPDGSLLASASYDSTIRLWDVTDHFREIAVFEGDTAWASVTFSPDGERLVAGGLYTFSVWNVAAAEIETSFETEGVILDTAFGDNGMTLVTSSSSGMIQTWDLNSAQESSSFSILSESYALSITAFNADGTYLFYVKSGEQGHVWDVMTGEILIALDAEITNITDSFFITDDLLVTAHTDATIRYWNLDTGENQATLEGHALGVNVLSSQSIGTIFASAAWDGTVRIWDTASGELQTTLDGFFLQAAALAFTSDGAILMTGGQDGVRAWDTTTWQFSMFAPERSVTTLAISPDDAYVAFGRLDRKIEVRDLATRTSVTLLEGHTQLLYALEFSPDGRLLASGGIDNVIRLWDTNTWTELQTLEYHDSIIQTLAFSADNRYLASGSTNGSVVIWDIENETIVTNQRHETPITSVQFNADSSSFAAADSTGAIWLYQMFEGEIASSTQLAGHTDRVIQLMFSPDGMLLASSSRDSTVRLWDISTGETRKLLEIPLAYGVAFNPDGTLLAVTLADGTISLWGIPADE